MEIYSVYPQRGGHTLTAFGKEGRHTKPKRLAPVFKQVHLEPPVTDSHSLPLTIHKLIVATGPAPFVPALGREVLLLQEVQRMSWKGTPVTR